MTDTTWEGSRVVGTVGGAQLAQRDALRQDWATQSSGGAAVLGKGVPGPWGTW